jgi:hypothetical protein
MRETARQRDKRDRLIYTHIYIYSLTHSPTHTRAYTCVHMHTNSLTHSLIHPRAYTCVHTLSLTDNRQKHRDRETTDKKREKLSGYKLLARVLFQGKQAPGQQVSWSLQRPCRTAVRSFVLRRKLDHHNHTHEENKRRKQTTSGKNGEPSTRHTDSEPAT